MNKKLELEKEVIDGVYYSKNDFNEFKKGQYFIESEEGNVKGYLDGMEMIIRELTNEEANSLDRRLNIKGIVKKTG